MPTPKSSEKASITDSPKVFTREMYKSLSIKQMMELEKQGWVSPHPVAEDWKEGWGGYTYKAPGFDPAKHLISPEGDTYVGGTVPKLPHPELDAVRDDPEMQAMAAKMGVSVNDLLLFRNMMLDRFKDRYNPKEQDQPDENA